MKVLITGGTGLVGTRLSQLLLTAGHEVALLSREADTAGPYKTFVWAPGAGTIDLAAVPFADVVVNLAGANVGEGRWTETRKKELVASRLDSLALLHHELAKPGHRVQAVLSASAIGFYGNTGDRLVTEETPPAHDFLAGLTQRWEQAAAPVAALGIRLVTPRIGVVLSAKGGALVPLAATVKRGLGATLGTGHQYLSWIHLDDLCQLFIAMLTDNAWQGPYNAVAPYPATNEAFTEVLAEVLHRPLLLPKVPGFALKLLLGEQSEIVLTGQRVSAEKVMAQGFEFDYPVLREALKELYSS